MLDRSVPNCTECINIALEHRMEEECMEQECVNTEKSKWMQEKCRRKLHFIQKGSSFYSCLN